MAKGTNRVEIETGLLAAVARGDREAFQELYATYAPAVFRFVLRMTRNEDLAEDLVNDVLVQVWKSAPRFEGRSKPSTWIFGIARRRTLMALRRRSAEAAELHESHVPNEDGQGCPDCALEAAERRARVRDALDRLGPLHREVVELTFFAGLSYPEISDVLSIPVNTVKSRMFQVRRRLSPALCELAGDAPLCGACGALGMAG